MNQTRTSIAENFLISLIVPTVGRVSDLDRLLRSLAGQTARNFELIIVDQNADDRVGTLLMRWRDRLEYLHIRSSPGASRARNAGVLLAQGDVVGFPDDDCWFPRDLISQVTAWFTRSSEYDFLCCSARDEGSKRGALRWPRRSQPIERESVLNTCICFAFFIRRSAFAAVGGFDETMGPGAQTPFQCGEETDLALRLLNNSHHGWFERNFNVYHPQKDAATVSSRRAFDYGMGLGHLLRKHHLPILMWIYQVIRAGGGALTSVCLGRPGQATFYARSAAGRILGFLEPPSKWEIKS